MPQSPQEIAFDTPDADAVQDDAQWWTIYDQSFPANEREPREVIVRSVRRGIGAAVRATLRGETVGLATLHLLTDPPAVFLVYLAIAPDLRGHGVGAQLFQRAWEHGAVHLQQRGKSASGMIWEVDAEEFTSEPAEALRRRRRIIFFCRQGGLLLRQSYFQPPVVGVNPVPMRLMYRPASGVTVPEAGEIHRLIRAIYLQKYGEANGIPQATLMDLLPRTFAGWDRE